MEIRNLIHLATNPVVLTSVPSPLSFHHTQTLTIPQTIYHLTNLLGLILHILQTHDSLEKFLLGTTFILGKVL